MSKDSGDLYTGITSAKADHVKETRQELRERKQRLVNDMSPAVLHINTVVATERSTIPTKMWDLIESASTEEHVKATAVALKLYDSFLMQLQSEINVYSRKSAAKGDSGE